MEIVTKKSMDQESIGATEQEHIDTGAIADCCVIDHVLTAGLEQENSTASTSADCYAMDQQMTVDLEQADTIITPDTYVMDRQSTEEVEQAKPSDCCTIQDCCFDMFDCSGECLVGFCACASYCFGECLIGLGTCACNC